MSKIRKDSRKKNGSKVEQKKEGSQNYGRTEAKNGGRKVGQKEERKVE